MAEHQQAARRPRLRQRLELGRKPQRDETVEGHAVANPETIKHRIGDKRILGRLPQSRRLLDK